MAEMKLSSILREYIKENKISQAACARDIGYHPSALTRFFRDEYCTSEFEAAVIKFLDGKVKLPEQITVTNGNEEKETAKRSLPEFFESRDALEMIGLCHLCQTYGQWGIIYGRPGIGKTYTLKHYSKLDRVIYIVCNASTGKNDLIKRIERAIGIPRTTKSADERLESISDFFRINRGYLLIIDEADKLLSKYSTHKIDIIKKIYDDSGVGVVIAGELALKTQISNLMHYVENRIGLQTEPQGLKIEEVKKYLAEFNVDEEAMNELVRRASGSRKSCFRLLDRTIQNVLHIIGDSQQVITADVIRQASDMMIL